MQDGKTVAHILAAEGIADYAQDLRQLSAEELRRLFAFASSGKINAPRCPRRYSAGRRHAIRPRPYSPFGRDLLRRLAIDKAVAAYFQLPSSAGVARHPGPAKGKP